MIRLFKTDLNDFTLEQYKSLFDRIDGVLSKRQTLNERYTRGSDDSTTLFDGKTLKIPFEKFIVDLATGYLSGTPDYQVDVPDKLSSKIRQTIFEKTSLTDAQINEMKAIIEYIANFNDDSTENYQLIRDLLLYGASYELIYENQDNEVVYNKLDAINTVAIWDTNVPENLLAIISKYTETNVENKSIDLYRVVDRNGIRVYNRDDKEVAQDTSLTKEHYWNDVPGFAVEINFSIIENSESVIESYEKLFSNVRETYKYNAEDCKMKINGYKAQNKAIIKDSKTGADIVNPARILEDEYVLSTKTFYTEEGGDADWLTKPIDAVGVTLLLKYYVDMVFQLCGIPNTSDLAFNSADLNASAIDRKFYVMNMKTQDIVNALKKGLIRRWELIFNRINFKKSTNYDFRYINIDIPKNLPSMTDETVDQMIKLNGLLSEETIISKLGYDYETEVQRKEDESLNGDEYNMDPNAPVDKGLIGETGEEAEDSAIKLDEGNEIDKKEPTTK